MKPTLVDSQIEVGNAVSRGGRWILDYSSVALIKLLCNDSGIEDDPFIKYQIDWGDGSIESSDFMPQARPFQFFHTFSNGDFIVRVWSVNRAGEKSDIGPYQTVSLRVNPPEDRKKKLYRWVGLCLPDRTIGTVAMSPQEVFPTLTFNLGAAAKQGAYQIILSSNGQAQGFQAGAEVTVFQPGKLITAARVISSDGTLLKLDSPLGDDYSLAATVEIRQRSYRISQQEAPALPQDWFFPKSYDEMLAKASIGMLLGTRPMERVMRPRIGSRIHELPFEQQDIITQQLAYRYSVDAVTPFEPRVQVRDVSFVKDPNNNELSIRVNFQFRGESTDEVFEAVLPLSLLTPSASI